MELSKPKNIFIHAISQRCGHNYLSKLIESQTPYKVMIHKNHEVIIPETFAYKMDELTKSSKFVRNKKAKIQELKTAAKSYSQYKENLIFKTSKLSSKYEIDMFPDMKHIILVRNPKDLFVSYEKSLYNFRTLTFKNKFKKLLRPFYTYYVMHIWSRLIKNAVAAYKTSETEYLLIKYEDILTKEGQQHVFNFIEQPIVLERKIQLENINSSFAKDSKRWKESSDDIGNTKARYEKAEFWLKWMINNQFSDIISLLNYQ